MWIDATVAASFVTNPNDSTVADSVGFALAPNAEGVEKRLQLALGLGARHPGRHDSRRTRQSSSSNGRPSRDYIELVAENEGWGQRATGRADLALTRRLNTRRFRSPR